MTSKNLFIKMLLQSTKEKIWGVALSVVGLLFAFPIYAIISIAMIRLSAENDIARAAILTRLFRMQVLGEGNVPVVLCTIGLAIYLAVNGFDYLFSRQKVDLYHALSVKRENLFIANYISGILIYAIPYVIFMIVTIIIGNINGMLDGRSIEVAMQMLVINITAFLLIYTSGIVGVMLVGNRAVGVIMIAVINMYFPVLDGIIDMFKQDYFDTYYSSYFLSDNWLSNISPIGAYMAVLNKLQSFKMAPDFSIKSVLPIVIASLVAFVITLLLYKIRPSEAAGKALAFKKSERALSVFILIIGALAGGSFLVAVIGYEAKDQTGWLMFGMISTAIIGHFILQGIFYQDFKALGKKLSNPVLALAIAGLIAAIFILDLTNFDGYIPAKDEFESAALSSYSLQSGIEYFDFNQEINEWGYTEVVKDQAEYRLDNMKLTDYELIKSLVEKGIEQTKRLRQSNADDFPNNTVEIVVKYNLKNGKEKYRSYIFETKDVIDEYTKFFETNEYKETVYPILADNNIEYDSLEYFDGVNMSNLKGLSKEQKEKLVDVCKAETYELKAAETINEVPIGYIYVNHIDNSTGYPNYYSVDKTFVYPSFEKTISLLKEYGVDVDTFKDASKVDVITISRYTDEGEKVVRYNDTEKIAEILEAGSIYEFYSNDGAFHMTAALDGSINRTGRDGKGEVIYFSLEMGKVPDFVEADLAAASINNEGIMQDHDIMY